MQPRCLSLVSARPVHQLGRLSKGPRPTPAVYPGPSTQRRGPPNSQARARGRRGGATLPILTPRTLPPPPPRRTWSLPLQKEKKIVWAPEEARRPSEAWHEAAPPWRGPAPSHSPSRQPAHSPFIPGQACHLAFRGSPSNRGSWKALEPLWESRVQLLAPPIKTPKYHRVRPP